MVYSGHDCSISAGSSFFTSQGGCYGRQACIQIIWWLNYRGWKLQHKVLLYIIWSLICRNTVSSDSCGYVTVKSFKVPGICIFISSYETKNDWEPSIKINLEHLVLSLKNSPELISWVVVIVICTIVTGWTVSPPKFRYCNSYPQLRLRMWAHLEIGSFLS